MQLKSILKLFVLLLSVILVYMVLTQEIPIQSRAGGLGAEVVAFTASPLRFSAIFVLVAIIIGYLIRTIRRL